MVFVSSSDLEVIDKAADSPRERFELCILEHKDLRYKPQHRRCSEVRTSDQKSDAIPCMYSLNSIDFVFLLEEEEGKERVEEARRTHGVRQLKN